MANTINFVTGLEHDHADALCKLAYDDRTTGDVAFYFDTTNFYFTAYRWDATLSDAESSS